MALITETEARAAAKLRTTTLAKSADAVLREERQTSRTSFDIFLSHSQLDAEIILGVKQLIEATGKAVYVDWIDDPQMNRASVTPATANQLRKRMRQSGALFYAHSGNAGKSRWMPWELGFFDALKGNVAILPIVSKSGDTFKGEEFLGLYPYVDLTKVTGSSTGSLWIHKSTSDYLRFDNWHKSTNKMQPGT